MTAPKPTETGPTMHLADRESDWWEGERERRAALERLVDSDPFPAQFFGTCPECGGKVMPGDEIVRRPDGTYVHAVSEQCSPDDPLAVGPRESLCARCFCYHAGQCA